MGPICVFSFNVFGNIASFFSLSFYLEKMMDFLRSLRSFYFVLAILVDIVSLSFSQSRFSHVIYLLYYNILHNVYSKTKKKKFNTHQMSRLLLSVCVSYFYINYLVYEHDGLLCFVFIFSLLLKVELLPPPIEKNKTSYMLFHFFFLVEKLYLSLRMYIKSFVCSMCRCEIKLQEMTRAVKTFMACFFDTHSSNVAN